MSLSEAYITPLCTTCRDALRLPGNNGISEGYTPVGKYEFTYTASHTFDPHDSHDGTCGFYTFLLGTMRSSDVTAMVRDQIGLEEQVMRMQQPPFVMSTEFWFRDNFMDSQREVDEQLLIGSLYFPLNPGLIGRQWRAGYVCYPLTTSLGSSPSGTMLRDEKAVDADVMTGPENQTSALSPPSATDHALSPGQIALMKAHLARCAATSCDHSSQNSASSFLPERLVDVRGAQPKVIQSSTLPQCGAQATDTRYLTLSYCWGEGDQLKLTHASAPTLHAGFSLDMTSETQRDTIALARALEIHFVWIDALCIQQGDMDDWTRESSLMHKIYGHSYVTVCSLTSASCREGYLARDWPRVVALRKGGGCYTMQGWMCSSSLPDGRKLAEQCRITSQWGRRAWTFQEEALSPRRIYFTRLGTHFSCDHPESSSLSLAASLTELSLANDGPQSSRDIYEAWYSEVVPSYSRRQVTDSADWLPALSGLAQRFASTLHNASADASKIEYVAGLWRSDLVYGLFWSWLRPPIRSLHLLLDALDNHMTSSTSYICPSWSWVGRGHIYGVWSGGGTGFIGRGLRRRPHERLPGAWFVQPAYDTIDVQVQPKYADLYGQIASASLHLTTQVFSLAQCEHPSLLHADGTRFVSHGPKSLVNPIHRFHLSETVQCSVIFDWAVQTSEEDLGPLLLVLIGTLSTAPAGHGGSASCRRGEAFGLVVHPSHRAEGKYLRVGSFGYVAPTFFDQCESRAIEIV